VNINQPSIKVKKKLGFGSYIGGMMLCILAVVLAFLGLVVLLGFLAFIPTSYNVILGIGMLVVALFMFAYGWYSYQSAKPKGTLNVHNQ
jgi:high-affinity Fe2+/Pb2+ permease